MPKSGATATSAQAFQAEKPDGSDEFGTSRDVKADDSLLPDAEVEGVEVHPATARSIVDTCRQLDESLAAAFIRGDIRLLRRAWLLEAPDQHLPYRQVLEEREGRGESPLLDPKEAAALLERGDRSIGALTHPWYSPGDPDPAGVKLKILREALVVLTHIEAIFVDYASLFQASLRTRPLTPHALAVVSSQVPFAAQHPPKGQRNPAENEAFKRALGVMGDVYASAVGTTVLQIKEIAPRPQEFDGALCLFGLKAGVDEAAVRQALRGGDLSAEFESCDLTFELTYGVVRFTTHAAALRAMVANAFSELCGGVGTRYNEHSYDGRGDGEGGRDGDEGRGWCCFEGGVSGELLVRLSVYPRMKAELSKLPPKLLSLASGRAPEPVELSHSDVWQRVQRVIETIEQATFTGKGDKEVVPKLYKSYVERVATVLTSTLALQTTLETAAEVPPMPLVDAPPTDALRLADGQLLLLLPGADARLAGGDGAWLAEVEASERTARNLFDGGVAELTFDSLSHAVIPWRPAEASLHRDLVALPALGERVQRLCDDQLPEDGLRALGEASMDVVADAAKLPVVAEVARQAEMEIRQVLKKVADYPPRGPGEEAPPLREWIESWRESLKRLSSKDVKSMMNSLREILERLSPKALDALAVAAWREGGLVGARRFAWGQRLVVRATDGAWREAAAEDACNLDGGPASLNPWNHAPLEMSLDAFEALRAWHTNALRAQHSHIVDALSGRRLDALKQCVAIEVVGGGAELASVVEACSFAAWLCTLHQERLAGGEATRPPATLLTAGPASGKSTLLSQLVALSLDSELVPILIKVQLLQQRLISSPHAFATAWNWVDAYLRLEHGEVSPLYRMLKQAMMARRALLLLDGLDEGGTNREQIERHVTEVLAPQGHVLLATSRPAGIDEVRFASFHRLRLSPLTPEQQEQALVQRLGHGRSAQLLDYVRERVPIDAETGLRVTANPLMLSMLTSVFELRTGLPMPSTVAELYKVASDVMLSRSGAASRELRRLLQAIFFEAQVSQGRVIEDRQLDEAALGLERPEALKAIRERARAQRHLGGKLRSSGLDETAYLGRAMAECAAEVRSACDSLPAAMRDALAEARRRVARDELPLLSLLQAEPLQLQSSHLSFQEYFAARALCEEGTLSGAPPWKWQASWANTLALGAGMGEPFAKGLKRAAGIGSDSLNLCGQLGGDRPTALRAVVMLSEALKTINLRGNSLGTEGWCAIFAALRDNKENKVESWDLSGERINVKVAKVLAEYVSGSAVLTSLDVRDNEIGSTGAAAIAEALRGNEVLTELNIGGNKICPEGGVAIGKALAVNGVLKTLNLCFNNIGEEGATAIGEALRGNAALTDLNLGKNKIGDKGAAALAIAESLRGNAVLKSINLSGNSIGAEGWCAIFAALRDNKKNKIESWDLSRQGINVDVAKVLAEYVSGSGVLTALDLARSGIDEAGAVALASALRVNAVLKTLDLYNNQIRAEGAAAIVEALRCNAVLTTLVLSYNGIGPSGATAIAEALQGNEMLTDLNLYWNKIGDEGATAIAEALRGNAVLKNLNLYYNNIGNTGAIAIAEALRGNAVLQSIDLRCNNIDGKVKRFSTFFGRNGNGKEVIRDAVSGRVGFELKM